MKKTIKNCLKKLCCNFCFMLLGTFSKAEIPTSFILNEMSATIESIKTSEPNDLNTKFGKHKYGKEHARKTLNLLPKKRKKIVKQSDFEVKELPKGEYKPQLEYDSNIVITRRIIIIKQ